MLSRCQRVSNLARCVQFQRKCISSQRNSTRSQDESILSGSAGTTWNEIFRQEPNHKESSSSSLNPHESEKSKSQGVPAPKEMRRQTITERESRVISSMLDLIFHKQDSDGPGSNENNSNDSKQLPQQLSVNKGGHIDDLVGRLRRHKRPLRWAKEPTGDLLDQKKEQMLSCSNDLELLQWAEREVFDESRRYEEAARKAMDRVASEDSESSSSSSESSYKALPSLQSPVYPQVIAHLMRTFRDHYNDPNLALFIFHHAQKLSIVSYVFGCSTEVYNELIKTRWDSFRDLQGVHDAIEEMMVNGVPHDSVTRKIVEVVRRDIGSQEMRLDSSEEAQQSVWTVLNKIEHMLASQAPKKDERKLWDQWKTDALNEGVDESEDWAFDDWSSEDRGLAERRRKAWNTRKALSMSH